jgi:exopolysaccharide biosynthesis polyprenyl glycosylphosphotransferase
VSLEMNSRVGAGKVAIKLSIRGDTSVAEDEGRVNDPRRRWEPLLALRVQRRSDADLDSQALGIEEAGQSPSVLRRERVLKRSLVLADALAVGFFMLILWRSGAGVRTGWLVGAIPAVVVLNKVFGLYDRDGQVLIKSTLDEVPRLSQTTLVMLLLAVTTLPREDGTGYSSFFVGASFVLYLATASLLRAAGRAYAESRCGPERYVAVGNPNHVLRLAERISSSKANSELVGVIPHERPRELDSRSADAFRAAQSKLPPRGRFRQSRVRTDTPVTPEDLAGYLRRRDAHRLLIATRDASSEQILDLIREAKALGIRVSLIPDVFEVVESSVEFEQISGTTALGIRSFSLSRSSRLLKRSFDLLLSSAITLLISPVLMIIAAAIKVDSRGTVLFSQTRVGRDGSRFKVLKFRTMVADAEAQKAQLRHLNEAGSLFKIEDDPRITRVGRLLRRTSLDELPQLFNVIRGEMSLVGPRPLIEEEDDQIQGWHRRRLHLTPGMTGHWQIMGSAVPLHEMVQIDYLYVANWSVWADVKTLLRTVPHVLAARSQ